MSHRFWRTHLGGDPAAIGRSLVLSGRPMVLVGVMPEGFWHPDADTDVWLPFGAPQPFMMNRAVHILRGVARLREGASAEETTRELGGILERIQREEPGSDPGHAIRVTPLHDRVVGNARAAILLLFGAVTAVTLLVCANIGSVLLARSVARRSEVAVRAALGAGGARLARPFLAESMLLGLAGGTGGLAIAVAGVPWLVARLPQGLPRMGEIRLDVGSVLFVVGASVLASLLFGLAPMVGSRGMAAADLLRGAAARSGGGRRDRRIRALVVAGHLAFAQVLLVTGGLFVLSFTRLQAVNPGFDASRLISMTVSLTSRYDRDAGIRYYESLPERLTALPGGGIESATVVSALPISGGDGVGELAIEGRPFAPEHGAQRELPARPAELLPGDAHPGRGGEGLRADRPGRRRESGHHQRRDG